MKNNTLLTLLLLLTISLTSLSAQKAGKIKYTETIKMEFDIQAPDGMDLSSMLPESTSFNKELFFKNDQSIYVDAKNNESGDVEMESDDGSFKIVIQMDEAEEIFHTDLKQKVLTQQTGFMGKDFLIVEALEQPKWKLTGEKVKYLGYECMKAEMQVKAQTDKEKDKHIIAWFAPSIPVQVGPAHYNQLPGAILMLSENGDKREIRATEILLDIDPTEKIKKPTKGKKVSSAEFEKIIEEKEKELKELHGEGIHINNH